MTKRAVLVVAALIIFMGDVAATMSLTSQVSNSLAYLLPSILAAGLLSVVWAIVSG